VRDFLWPRRGERLLPVTSAILLAASFPPLHPLLLPFVGLVPLALWIQALPPDGDGRRAAVRGGLAFGVIYFGIVFYWILVALVWFTKLAILAYLGSIATLAALAALLSWALHRAVHEVRAPLWLALPVVWTAAEWFRAHWPSSLAFPWLGLGTSLSGFPELVGMAEIVGARGVTFWIALLNGLVATLVLRWRERRPLWGWMAAIVALLVLPTTWGVWRAATLPVREAARVAVVQPDIPEHIKLDATQALDSTFASLDRLLPRVEPGSVDLVVLPEVTLPLYPRSPTAVAPMARVQGYSREVGAPFLLGGLGYEETGSGGYVAFNSAFLMEPQGLTDYEYDKRFLVPFVERVPLVPSGWLTGLRYFGGFGVGQGWPLAEIDETAYGVLICYESTYPEAARTFRREGADVLLNITNDAWYGREPWYARTSALWQHPAHMVMRAIENRTGVARAANTGISLFIDPVGRVYNATQLFEADLRIDTVYTTDLMTFYTRFGDLLGNGSAIATLILLISAWSLNRRIPPLDRSAGHD
jgi:apolipoprotein N-acyltransferase